MLQAGRNLTDSESGAMRGKGYLILDRDTAADLGCNVDHVAHAA
jgi:hypothetical protein